MALNILLKLAILYCWVEHNDMEIANLELMASALQVPDVPAEAVLERITSLKDRYDEPWRYYHSFEHPCVLFSNYLYLQDKGQLKHGSAVGWAILYHDAIYDPTAIHGRNEELSAQLAEHELPEIVGEAVAAQVARYTRATAEHEVDDTDQDLNFFLDLDLGILGTSPHRYDRYSMDIRREYQHVPDDQYRLGRIAILGGLAKRVEQTGLFRTKIFRDLFEERAQQNIARETASLQPE